jgi:hypothetical protein
VPVVVTGGSGRVITILGMPGPLWSSTCRTSKPSRRWKSTDPALVTVVIAFSRSAPWAVAAAANVRYRARAHPPRPRLVADGDQVDGAHAPRRDSAAPQLRHVRLVRT